MDTLEKKAKPYYNKSNGEKVFKTLRQEAQLITAELEPKKRFEIRFKAVLFPLLYLGEIIHGFIIVVTSHWAYCWF
jgi:hypothetical protein